ncbi:MAG: thioredoxin fold domain-containing protein [Acidiferrobacter sp.]
MRYRYGRKLLGVLGVLTVTYSAGALGASIPFQQSLGPSGPGVVLAHIAQADRIVEGHGSRHLTVFMDPNCPYCHKLFLALQPLIASDHLTVNWVVVGILRRTSPGKAAAILGAAHPFRALMANEHAFNLADGGGGIPPGPVRGPGGRGLHRNNRLFRETGAGGVPDVLFVSRSGRTVMLQGVSPSSRALARVMARIAS